MKKEYIKPEMIEEVLFTQTMMITGSNGNATDDPDDDLARGRRGTWGNLWDED